MRNYTQYAYAQLRTTRMCVSKNKKNGFTLHPIIIVYIRIESQFCNSFVLSLEAEGKGHPVLPPVRLHGIFVFCYQYICVACTSGYAPVMCLVWITDIFLYAQSTMGQLKQRFDSTVRYMTLIAVSEMYALHATVLMCILYFK